MDKEDNDRKWQMSRRRCYDRWRETSIVTVGPMEPRLNFSCREYKAPATLDRGFSMVLAALIISKNGLEECSTGEEGVT